MPPIRQRLFSFLRQAAAMAATFIVISLLLDWYLANLPAL